jgi:hypothetical protein
MFFQPLIKCFASQLLMHKGRKRTYATELSQSTQEYSLYRKALVALLSSDNRVKYLKQVLLACNCVVRNNDDGDSSKG